MFQQCNGVATTVAGFFSGQVCSLGSAGAKRLEAAQLLRLWRTLIRPAKRGRRERSDRRVGERVALTRISAPFLFLFSFSF